MVLATFEIDGHPGRLSFVSRDIARRHVEQMIEFFGARMIMGDFKSCTNGDGPRALPVGGLPPSPRRIFSSKRS